MAKLQFRVLYRDFLFRMVDLEVLSAHAQGDASKLLGQFAALLIFLSLLFTVPSLGFGNKRMPAFGQLLLGYSMQHFLIATTMLVVGLFAVLSWDSTFPDRRDVLVLAPLPVRARTIFLAKVAAVASALSLTVLTLHAAAGLIWPLALNSSIPAQTMPALTWDSGKGGDALTAAFSPGGALGPGTGAGLVVGTLRRGERHIAAYGTAKPDSIFEIGSISKTFTGLILARAVVQGKARLEEPVRELLPPDTVAKPRGREITLLDLATHHSGLPRNPGNIHPDDWDNPLADYRPADLYEYMARRGVARPSDAEFLYSNLGVALLGQALASRAGMSYPDLAHDIIAAPLGMRDTAVTLSPEQQARSIQGHDAGHRPVHAWDFDAFAPAGGLRSTAADMLNYLEANLHPERLSPELTVAVRRSQELHADVAQGMRIALTWAYNTETGAYWASGGTGGFSSYAFFQPRGDYAAIVLLNTSPFFPMFTDLLGERIRRQFAGEPAYSLEYVRVPASGGFLALVRLYAAYWMTMLAAGAFVFCLVLLAQGLAAQLLPRRYFLRVSSVLQMASFCLFVSVYFLQPMMAGPEAVLAAQGRGLLAWSPSYWFLGLFQQLNGSPAMALLARRAWIGLLTAAGGAAVAYLLSYLRTLRNIVEEPDIVSGAHGIGWLPRFGDPPVTAIVQFAVRTLLRSRLHRMLFAFYLGIGFAITIFFLRSPAVQKQFESTAVTDPWRQVSAPLLASSIVMMCFWIVGVRVVFSMPLDLRANWVFRITPVRGGAQLLHARRRSLLVLSLVPAWITAAAIFLSVWPWRAAAAHLAILGLLGTVVAELCLSGTQKLPFTCSYLPGKTRFHMTFWACISLIVALVEKGAEFERRALDDPASFALIVVTLATAAAAARWFNASQSPPEGAEVPFEEVPSDAVQVLGLS